MNERILRPWHLSNFRINLVLEEKSPVTIQKYLRDVQAFLSYTRGQEVTKELTIGYKVWLQEQGYAIRSINSMLASVNSLLTFLGWHNCRVKALRSQRQTYCAEEKELTKGEYLRLLEASKHQPQLNLPNIFSNMVWLVAFLSC